jgi:hypothetical protein
VGYDGPGFIIYFSEISKEYQNIIVEATGDIGTAWYYSIVIKNDKIVNQFYIKEPRTNSDKFSLDEFIKITLVKDSILYKFKKSLISSYSNIPSEGKTINGNFILSKSISSNSVNPSNENLLKTGEFQILFKRSCDLNQDEIIDSIIVMKRENDSKANNYSQTTGKIVVKLSNGSGYRTFENSNIFPNQTGDHFTTIDIKSNFFTIRLYNEIPDQFVVEKFITFICLEINIFLNSFTKIKNGQRNDYDMNKMKPILFEDFYELDENY